MKQTLVILCCFMSFLLHAQDSSYLKIHFLYGSRPLKQYKHTEQKWFGGILGGHVGIEGYNNKIVNFLPAGKFRWFAKNNSPHSRFAVHPADDFYAILGGNPDSVKKLIIYIPVTGRQKQIFDSITTAYLQQTPYDYALFGMRCGAAAYDILAALHIVTGYDHSKTYRKIFYPKKLRKRLLKKAAANGWAMVTQQGSAKRRWEKD